MNKLDDAKMTEIWQAPEVCEALNITKRKLQELRNTERFGPEELGMSTRTSKYYSAGEIITWLKAGCPMKAEWLRVRGKLRF